jgi:hypothetical protein
VVAGKRVTSVRDTVVKHTSFLWVKVKVVLCQEDKIIVLLENVCCCISFRDWMRHLRRIILVYIVRVLLELYSWLFWPRS